MAKMSAKTEERLKSGLKKYQKILQTAVTRDINESDTVTIIRDMLHDIFGYDKYTEITSEYLIRGTFCDLAIIIEGKKHFLIEAKAVGLALKEMHMRQAIGYAANEGIDWVILTNGIIWQIFKLTFQKPIDFELIFSIDFLNTDAKDKRSMEMLYLLSKEGMAKSAIEEFQLQNRVMNRFAIAALILSENVIAIVRKELKKISKNVKIDSSRLIEIIQNDIIKRDILEDERFIKETKKFKRAGVKIEKSDSKTELCEENSADVLASEEQLKTEEKQAEE